MEGVAPALASALEPELFKIRVLSYPDVRESWPSTDLPHGN